jgi:hypothetical protein
MRMMLSINRLLTSVFPWHDTPLVKSVAGEVARQCRDGLCQRVCRRAADMSIAEIRGYARAHAAEYVRDEVEQALRHRRVRLELRSRIAEAAVDQLVGMVARDMLTGQTMATTRTMAA